MQLKTQTWSGSRVALVLAFIALALLLILMSSSAAVQSGPKLWQTGDGQFDNLPFARDGLHIRYQVPPSFDAEGKDLPAVVALDASLDEVQAAFQAKNVEKFTYGPDRAAYEKLLARESALLNGEVSKDAFGDGEFLGQPEKGYLAVVVEYGESSTFTRDYPVDPADPSLGCSEQEFTFGPLFLGDDPPPAEWDNFSFHKEDMTLDDYRSAIFGTGPDAGYGLVREELDGGVDLSGYSLNNYLLEMNPPDSPYTTSGDILPESVVLPNAHEYYGAAVYSEDEEGNCVSPTFSDIRYRTHIQDVVAGITEQYDGDETIDWSAFDADGDHTVDLLAVIHAGRGFQNGGGEDRLSTSSSSFSEPVQVVGFTTPDDDSDDYFIKGYNINPESMDVGAIQEEFEHQFGIPDFYSTDLNNSNAWWASHSSGVWGGDLGGTRPMGTNLWASWLLGRKDPVIYEWNDPALLAYGVEMGVDKAGEASAEKGVTIDIGRMRYKPEGTEDGVIIRLPQGGEFFDNFAGEGTGWWSDFGDELDNRVYRDFDLSAATGEIIFSFDAYWDIEEDWDYGLIQFSTDGGETWSWPQDMDGVLTDQDPNETQVPSPGERWALTGQGDGTLRWDISAFAGETVTVMIRYFTDVAVSNPGYQVDNLMLVDGSGTLYENDLEEDFSDWTNEGWRTVPFTNIYDRYYMLEYRVANGFDQSLNNPYWFTYSEDGDGYVDRLPATDEVLQISYRDQSQGFDYTLGDAIFTGNSIGPKYGHLVVDSHPFPQMWDIPDAARADLVGRNMSGRVMPGDAGFGLHDTDPWMARYDYNPQTGEGTPANMWDSRPPVQAFHDSYGYTPGFFWSPETPSSVYFWDRAASVVLPARGPYTTPITDVNGDPLDFLYGATVAGFELGSGNPGDSHVQYGLHVEVLSSTEEHATVRIWNRPFEAHLAAVADVAGETTFMVYENIGGLLEDPYLVVELPENVMYVEDSAFGGFMPVGADSMEAALAKAQQGIQPTAAQAVTHLVWHGMDIPTRAMMEDLGGFAVEKTGSGNVMYAYDLYRNGNNFVQSGHVQPGSAGPAVFMPLVR